MKVLVETLTRNYIRKTVDRVGFTRDVMEKFADEINAAGRILIKPNIVSHEHYPTTTHPDLLETILDLLDGRDVAVGDGMAVDMLVTRTALTNHPLSRVCEKRGVPMLDMHQGGSLKLKSPRKYSFSMSRLPKNFDYVISLPVLKVHSICTMTGALKNQFGYFTKGERIKMHSRLKDINKAIAEVNAMVPADLFIIDAVTTLVGTNEVRHGGRPSELGYMLAGKDPVALDAKGLELLQTVEDKLWGLEAVDVPYIRYAMEYGVGDPAGKVVEI